MIIKDNPLFDEVCKTFFFKIKEKPEDNQRLIFLCSTSIFEIDIETEEIKHIFTFNQPFDEQPDFFCHDEHQKVFMVATFKEAKLIDLEGELEFALSDSVTEFRAFEFDKEDN